MQNREAIVVSNLDALIDREFVFQLHGKNFSIQPISTAVFLDFTEKLAQLYASYGNLGQTPEVASKFADDCEKLLQSVIPSLTKDDLIKCTPAQIAGLFTLVIDHVRGADGLSTDLEKKKTLIH